MAPAWVLNKEGKKDGDAAGVQQLREDLAQPHTQKGGSSMASSCTNDEEKEERDPGALEALAKQCEEHKKQEAANRFRGRTP